MSRGLFNDVKKAATDSELLESIDLVVELGKNDWEEAMFELSKLRAKIQTMITSPISDTDYTSDITSELDYISDITSESESESDI